MFYVYRLRSVSCLRNYNYINRSLFGSNSAINQSSFQFRTHNTTSDSNIENMAAKITQSSSSNQTATTTSTTHTNRLAQEKSPYLLQHATNPVDWYPWCDEAIQKAKTENKLIFLSVGYSTCHWCHVMEKESFEDEEVAKLMNENYVNIKVDREERPDIDKIYMMFVLMINGSGGWPMSVWLTPDLAPLTAGTYFPPNDRWGMPGFKSILTKISQKWKDNAPELTRTGHTVIQALQKNANEKSAENENVLTAEGKLNQCIGIYKRNFDSEWGGFGRSPKFPEVSKLNLLLHAHFKQPKGKIADLVLTTLTKIANGGIHDHVFGGFARYSVDQKWHVPHFEKMLYDQGQLLVAYSNAYRLTSNRFFLDICENIVKYICKDLKHPNGGFYSGEDADSLPTHSDNVKVEGAFYAWSYAEVEDAIKSNHQKFKDIENVEPFEIYSYHYDIENDGNVEPSSDPQGHLLGKNILFVKGSVKDTAKKFKIKVETVNHILTVGNEILYEIRSKRPRPHLDTKIICAWNGLLLSGLAKLSCIASAEKQKEYLAIAKQLIEFLKMNLYNSETKTLMRSCYGEGTNSDVASHGSDPIPGFLDDYAFLIKGLLDYYVASQQIDVLHWAVDLQKTQDDLFLDKENGAYFYSQADSPNVIVRLKEDHDGAEPCGNSMSVHNLMYLNTYFEDHKYKDTAKQILDFFENSSPFGYVLPHMMSGLILFDSGLELLVVVGPDNDDSKKLLQVAKNFFIPGLVPIQIKIDRPEDVTRKSAFLFKMIKDMPTAYICHNQVCQLPITKPEELSESLAERYLYKCDAN